jgi:PAP2 superfamily C-terminal
MSTPFESLAEQSRNLLVHSCNPNRAERVRTGTGTGMNRRRQGQQQQKQQQQQQQQHRRKQDEPGMGGALLGEESTGNIVSPRRRDNEEEMKQQQQEQDEEDGGSKKRERGLACTSVASPCGGKNQVIHSESITTTKIVLAVVAFSLLSAAVVRRMLKSNVIDSFRVLQGATLLPVVFVAGSVVLSTRTRRSNGSDQKRSQLSNRALSATLVVSVVGAQLPIHVGAAMACGALLVFALATLPSNSNSSAATVAEAAAHANDEKNGVHDNDDNTLLISTPRSKSPPVTTPIQIINATVVLLIVLLTENFMVWVVAATFHAGQNAATEPPPLQDNGRLVLNYVLAHYSKRQVVSGLRRLWNVQWSLVACIASSFAVVDVWHHPRRQLYGVARRAVLTLASARALRTISFLLTVLPSQVPQCYSQRFPNPPPSEWMPWIQVGLLPAAHGGCNDLIVSGHATVVTTLACVITSVSSDPVFQAAVWVLLALDFAVEVYEGFHYSVDMWLGCVLVCLIWRVLQPLENEQPIDIDNDAVTKDSSGATSSSQSGMTRRTFRSATRRDALWYGIPTALAYLQATNIILPKSTANAVIIGYVVSAVLVYARSRRTAGTAVSAGTTSSNAQPSAAAAASYVHYAQHILLCVGLITLVTYL